MELKLEAGKTYIDADDRKVRIICTDRAWRLGTCVGLMDLDGHETIHSYKKDGTGLDNCNLVREYDPLEKLPVDTPVWVRDHSLVDWEPRHYAGYKDERGHYVTFTDGNTSHSNGNDPMIIWDCMTNVNPYN